LSNPTQAQIHAIGALPHYYVDRLISGAWVQQSVTNIVMVRSQAQSTGNIHNGLAFGTAVVSTFVVECTIDEGIGVNWYETVIRVRLGYDTSSALVVAQGIIESWEEDYPTILWQCRGYDFWIERTPCYSPVVYRRPIATLTSAASIEDPTQTGYAAGLINLIFWNAGGRPYEQQSSYATALFYYSCDQALIAPEFSWVSGDNGWKLINDLASIAGGQIYQDLGGVIYYRNPLSFAYGTAVVTLTPNYFEKVTVKVNPQESVNEVRCTYMRRYIGVMQEVHNDTTPRLILPSQSRSFISSMQYPVYSYESGIALSGALPAADYVANMGDGSLATTSQLTATITQVAAEQIMVGYANTTTEPSNLQKTVIHGQPVIPEVEQMTSIGSGIPSLRIPNSPLIQTLSHANRLCQMVYDFYNPIKGIITLHGFGFDPTLGVGQLVYLTTQRLNVTNLLCRIVGIQGVIDPQQGAICDLQLIDVSGLPKITDCFIIGTVYVSTDVRILAY
jgi:hypothetical protein